MPNELVTLNLSDYPALDPTNDRVKLMMANLGGESLTIADFNRLKVPTGGGTKWQIDSAEGATVADVLEGVILYTTRRRAYWSNPNPTMTPPDCASADMLNGQGTPGGPCVRCLFNQFGSSTNHRGKACKEARLVFLLRPGQMLPDVVAFPPGSLKAIRKYLVDLSSVPVPYFGVVTQFGLTRVMNADGIAYARITAKMVGKLDPDTLKAMLKAIDSYAETFQAATVEAVDVHGGDPEEV